MPSFEPDLYTIGLLFAYSVAVIVASVLGGMLPEWIRITHTGMQLMISFVGGIMLGIAVFHMVPHALVATHGDIDQVTWGVMLGLVTTFFLLRFFHFHQHGPADFGLHAEEQLAAAQAQQELAGSSAGDLPMADSLETHLCSEHTHPADGCSHESHRHVGATRWIAVLIGLGLHTLMDGIAMGSGIVAEAGHHPSWLPGFGIFLAVFLHKPLDAVSITSLMHPVTTPGKRLLVNVGFALMCPVGAFLCVFGAVASGTWFETVAAWALAFSAGVFLCISLSDLLPEMEFHSHNRIRLSVALLLGIAAAWAIGLLEGEHAHSHNHAHGSAEAVVAEPGSVADHSEHDHDHADHDH